MDPKVDMSMQEKWSRTFDGFRDFRVLVPGSAKPNPGTLAAASLSAIGNAMAEVIWPTRCIICDTPGYLLCPTCRLCLPYIDRYLACPRCGSPHGRMQCVDCNKYTLGEVGRNALPFAQCVSAIEHRGFARSIATGYKDAGERRLAAVIAQMIADAMPLPWSRMGASIAYVPADRRARRRRGFDHMALVAHELAGITGMPCIAPIQKLNVADQRGLGRSERFQNMAHAIRPAPGFDAPMPERVVLVDDVYTTGATLFAATDTLLHMGVREVRCATFARAI